MCATERPARVTLNAKRRRRSPVPCDQTPGYEHARSEPRSGRYPGAAGRACREPASGELRGGRCRRPAAPRRRRPRAADLSALGGQAAAGPGPAGKRGGRSILPSVPQSSPWPAPRTAAKPCTSRRSGAGSPASASTRRASSAAPIHRSHGPSAERLVVAGRAPEPVHNNCSGKHTAMLAVARHIGAPLAGYTQADHPVQRQVAATLAEMAGAPALPEPAVDGCGVPTYPLTLGQLATAMARLADPRALRPARAAACREIGAAMTAHPQLVAGRAGPARRSWPRAPEVIVKTGAEGVYGAALPRLGLGLALKVEDGAGRAATGGPARSAGGARRAAGGARRSPSSRGRRCATTPAGSSAGSSRRPAGRISSGSRGRAPDRSEARRSGQSRPALTAL